MQSAFEQELMTVLYSKKYRCWYQLAHPTSAYLYKKDSRLDLLTGKEQAIGIDAYWKKVRTQKIFSTKTHNIHHWFYELGNQIAGLKVSNESNLVLELSYTKCQRVKIDTIGNESFFEEVKQPNYAYYQLALEKILQAIRDGEFYQLNFTEKFKFSYRQEITQLVRRAMVHHDKLGAMAHFTSIPLLKKLWFSNTPECLFVIKKEKDKNRVTTFPIKGTQKIINNKKSALKKLLASQKDLAELDMITDLMRNDLNKLELPTAQVEKRRFVFSVPGLLQQASKVSNTISTKVTIYDLIHHLFPGGSITGAPKIASMKYIQQLEKQERGFYCGTTLYHSSKNCSASINIRSLEFELRSKEITIGAGGGITLKSDITSEWQEMLAKKESILGLWKNNE